MLKSIWKAIRLAFCLTAFITLTSSYSIGAPSVLVVAWPSTNSQTTAWKLGLNLMRCSADGSKRIADLSHHILFGSDDSVVALVEIPDDSAKPNRLLVIDRQTFAIITNITITGEDSLGERELPVENLLAVQSTNYAVYFPTFDNDFGHQGFSFAEVSWKTGKVRQFPASRSRDHLAGDISDLISIPSGFAVMNGIIGTIDLYDATTQKKFLTLHTKGDESHTIQTVGLRLDF